MIAMQNIHWLCRQFAEILGGKPSVKHGICTVERDRPHIRFSILGRPGRAVVGSEWSFESMDPYGRALNLGETALLEEEAGPFTSLLQKNGILLSALHNHWLMDRPPLLYAHYQSIEEPLSFARKVAEAYSVLK
jgi:hypothetical protein